MIKKTFPKISVITPTLNNEKDLQLFFKTINNQNYPKNKIEVIVSDGGSNDKTKEIVKKNKARIIKNPDVLAEPGIYHGMKKASGEIITVLAVDNIYKDKNAFRKIATVFNNSDIYAAFPKHVSSKNDNLFTKYINTFTDPFNHFVYGYAANARTFHKIYKNVISKDLYDIYNFLSSDALPMVAIAQGFSVKKEFVKKRNEKYDDLVSVIQIIKEGKKIAYIHNLHLFHHTIKNKNHFIRKQRWATKNVVDRKKYGIGLRENDLGKKQKLRIKIYPIYSISLVLPIIYSLYHAVKDKEVMWLFHPVINTFCLYAIIKQIIIMKVNKSNKLSRQ